MPLETVSADAAIAALDRYSAVIDARSESEYAADRLPGARNWPVLNDRERALIGTEYATVSPFAARKRGAALVARNIARHIERELLEVPKDWHPLVYCWRGGQRSGALALVLAQIGFRVHVIQGGYQAYRRAVLAALDTLPARYRYHVVCGRTGAGKSRLLRALASRGAQVLDLEAMANHRGSVLGLAPGQVQPGQKQFESRLYDALRRFDPSRVVWVESESRTVGALRLPAALVDAFRTAPGLRLDTPSGVRVALLLEDYAHFVQQPDAFCERLDALRVLRGHELVNRWQAEVRAGRVAGVVEDLLARHYDPVYDRSMRQHFAHFDALPAVALEAPDAAALDAVAARALTLGDDAPAAAPATASAAAVPPDDCAQRARDTTAG